jgi:methionyl-tRNA formyltransferase
VKEAAAALGLPIAQPRSRAEVDNALREHGPFDIGLVVAYGRILSPEALSLPTHGILNVHFSLLPRWRGAAPVARALIAGDSMTGVTIMKLDEGLDTGPVLTAQAVDILADENAGELTSRLAVLGARLLSTSIGPYLGGDLVPVAQSEEGLTYAERIEPVDRPLAISFTVDEVVNRVRALAPVPGATLDIDGDRHKILEVRPASPHPTPGTWEAKGGVPIIGLSDGGLELVALQPPGRNPQSGADWLRGRHRDRGIVE